MTAAPRIRRGLTIRAWTAEEFAGAKSSWDRLMGESPADPLFMSWDWQWRWWAHHAGPLGATLRLLAVYDPAGRLVGIAPFYSRSVITRGIFRTCRLELIGLAWRHGGAAFSEYLDLISASGYEEAVVASVAEYLHGRDFWHELVLAFTKPDSLASRLVGDHLTDFAYVRNVDSTDAWRVHLPARFSTFVETLPSDVRRRLFNQRKKLEMPVLERAGGNEARDYLEQLWTCQAARWGGASRLEAARAFHIDFAQSMARAGRLQLTRLVAGPAVVSVLYDVRVGNTEYYLQSAFCAQASMGVSPGYLHLGYAIEDACERGLERFDLLAGSGRHRDYKRDFRGERIPLASYHAIRGRLPRAAYAAYEWTRAVWRRSRRSRPSFAR